MRYFTIRETERRAVESERREKAKPGMIRVKRVYDPPDPADGARFLVDRVWPRGVSRSAIKIEAWCKETAPSDTLRRWFAHDPRKWQLFQKRYFDELDRKPDAWQPILKAARQGAVTLLYSARDTRHNNAVALQAYLEKKAARARGRRDLRS